MCDGLKPYRCPKQTDLKPLKGLANPATGNSREVEPTESTMGPLPSSTGISFTRICCSVFTSASSPWSAEAGEAAPANIANVAAIIASSQRRNAPIGMGLHLLPDPFRISNAPGSVSGYRSVSQAGPSSALCTNQPLPVILATPSAGP